MSTRKMIIRFFICLSIVVFAGQTLSQTQEPENAGKATEPDSWTEQWQRRTEQRRQQWEMQNKKRIEQLDKQMRIESAKKADKSMKQALLATERQWKVIKPRFDKVEYLSKQARVSITPASFRRSRGSGGLNNQQTAPKPKVEEGWKWSKSWEKKAPGELTKGERTCEELLLFLEDKDSNQEEIEQKVEALREIRKEASEQLAKAQQELREVLTFRQEATLVLMRYLN
ncbi:MAG: hypothetical protein RQ760_03345 [Sedimentisphaerales bacterium]|nr:hypothetical protein [Sedimentisphaerales bacterium]